MLTSRLVFLFFFQAEDGIRDLVRSRGLGDVYKRQAGHALHRAGDDRAALGAAAARADEPRGRAGAGLRLSLIHI